MAEKPKRIKRVSSKKDTHKTTKGKPKASEAETQARELRKFLFPHASD